MDRNYKYNFTMFACFTPSCASALKVLADGRELPLYGAGGFKFIWNPKFDAAMVAFLECLQELQVGAPTMYLTCSRNSSLFELG